MDKDPYADIYEADEKEHISKEGASFNKSLEKTTKDCTVEIISHVALIANILRGISSTLNLFFLGAIIYLVYRLIQHFWPSLSF